MDFGNCATGGGGNGGGREDCWSEGATEALVEAWGDRFLHLSRGNLRQNDWKDVGDSVNARQDAVGKPRKTSGQCKNRIDTLKKKYKLEKSKPGPSTWPFLSRLDLLVGTSADSSSKKRPISIRVKQLNPNSSSATPPPSLLLTSWGSSRVRTNFPDATQSSREGSEIGCDDCDGEEHMNRMDEEGKVGLFKTLATDKRRQPCCGSAGFSHGAVGGVGGDHEDFKDLARSIERIAEIYERVERSKLQQSIELEKQRMEFEKDLEIQRMRVFTEMLLELEKVKRPKYASDSGFLRTSCTQVTDETNISAGSATPRCEHLNVILQEPSKRRSEHLNVGTRANPSPLDQRSGKSSFEFGEKNNLRGYRDGKNGSRSLINY